MKKLILLFAVSLSIKSNCQIYQPFSTLSNATPGINSYFIGVTNIGGVWYNYKFPYSSVGGGTVTSINVLSPLIGGVITTNGSISIPKANSSIDGYLSHGDWALFNSKGTITSITAGAGLNGGVITSSGTISLNSVGSAGTYGSSTQVPVFTTDATGRVITVTNTAIAASSGTVTSITAGYGLLGGTITASGTITPDTTILRTKRQLDSTYVPYTGANSNVNLGANSITASNYSGTSSGTNTGDQIITLTGDVSGTGTGSFSTSLTTTGVSAGSYGDATHTPSVNVDVKGRITNSSSILITPNAINLTGATLASSIVSSSLTGVSALSSGSIATGFTAIDNLYLNQCVGVLTSTSSAINTTETVILSSSSIAANRWQVGTILQVWLFGTCTSTVANTNTFALRLGTTGTVSDGVVSTVTTGTAATSGTTVPFEVSFYLTVTATGVSATCTGSMNIINNATTGISTTSTQNVLATTSNFNSTTANNILSITYKSAASTTTCTFRNGYIRYINK